MQFAKEEGKGQHVFSMYKCFVQRADWFWRGSEASGSVRRQLQAPHRIHVPGRLFYVHGKLPVSWLMDLLVPFLFIYAFYCCLFILCL